jgi:hypothetical protein
MSGNKKSELDQALDFFNEVCELNGVACSTVDDGHILKFKMSFLKSLVEKYSDKDEIVLCVQRPDFRN